MSLKDIFEWIINVNLFYVIGAVVALIAVANISEWFDANKEKFSVIFDNILIFWIMLLLFVFAIIIVL